MIKRLLISLTALIVMYSAPVAETLNREAEGVFVTDKVQKTFAMNKGQRLIINAASNLGGEIFVRAEGKEGQYTYQKRLRTPTKVEAGEYAGAISVEIDSQKDIVTLFLRAPARVPWGGTNNSGRLEIHITIPDSCAVECNTAYFDIDAVGPFGEFTITESLSKAQVEKVFGLLDIKVSNRPLIVRNVTGQLTVTNKYERIKLENIDIGESLGVIWNEHGEVTIDTYRGGLDLRNSYERIVAQNLVLTGTRNRVKNVSAPITLSFDSMTSGKLRVNNQYGPITVSVDGQVDAQFICKTGEGGKIMAENMDIVPTLVDNSRLEFDVGEGTAEVRLTIRESGDILVNKPDRTGIAGGKK